MLPTRLCALLVLSITTLSFVVCSSSLHAKVHALDASAPSPSAASIAAQITYTRVVPDFGKCGSSSNTVAMCASRGFVCRMPDGQAAFASEPSCLPFDPQAQGVNPREKESTAPWDTCDPDHTDVNLPTCRLSFQCMCAVAQSKNGCRCVPPDAVPGRSLTGESCGKAATTGGACANTEYCKWTPAGEQECGAKPYFS